MLQIRTSVVAGMNGSRKAVVGSGTTSMSLSWISWKPRIEDPSKPMPSLKASASTALGGTEKCCQVPGKSVKRKSIIWTFLPLIDLSTSSAFAQLRNMASLHSYELMMVPDNARNLAQLDEVTGAVVATSTSGCTGLSSHWGRACA